MALDLELQDWQKLIQTSLGTTDWVTVYSKASAHKDIFFGGFFCALIPNSKITDAMKHYGWDLRIGEGGPSFVTHFDGNNTVTEYFTNVHDGIEALVHHRSFFGTKEDYLEISEEFRLFHNLYEERTSLHDSRLIHIDDNGDEIEVVRISPHEIAIRLKYIKQYISAKQMHLAIFLILSDFLPTPCQN